MTQTYGSRPRFGPYWRQAVRFVGRSLEQLGSRLDSWSWGFTDDAWRETWLDRLRSRSWLRW